MSMPVQIPRGSPNGIAVEGRQLANERGPKVERVGRVADGLVSKLEDVARLPSGVRGLEGPQLPTGYRRLGSAQSACSTCERVTRSFSIFALP
jgi:hypothetical protein